LLASPNCNDCQFHRKRRTMRGSRASA
jgi:hypothetical protein